ncbi:MAG: hypothetical protein LBT25_05235 [Candidatus Symbiothrix sp.]|jgi:hypothetical protein|nr:hypothetical protein [Candidatus Symbiothrix sp.]
MELNLVETKITVAGKKVSFARLKLQQAFNQHGWFEIEIDHNELEEKWMNDPIPIIKYIGLDVCITMQHRQTGEQNLFAGIITNVSFTGHHGQQNFIVLTGASPTIKLDGKPTMDSFMDLPLQQVVDEAVANSGNGVLIPSIPRRLLPL